LFPISLPLWKAVPKMQFMQFPWRWLLCMSLTFTIFASVAFRNWWTRSVVCGLALLVVVGAWHRVQSPWWDNRADLREMQDNMYTGAGYEGTDEYTPQGADPTAIDKDARKVTVDGPARGAIRISRWDPEFKEFTADLSAADRLALRLFPYPAWRVDVNGHTVQTSARAGSGQMLVPVGPGVNRVRISFVRTWDRTLGGWISLISLSALAIWSYRKRSGRQVSA